MRQLAVSLLPFLMAQSSPQPLVPEGIHSLANGTETICGITASSAAEFQRQVMASSAAKKIIETEEFVGFEGPEDLTMWVFSKPGAAAYPLATCRRIYIENGATYMDREMRCDDSREKCDRALLQFQALDEQAKTAVQQTVRRKR